MNSDKLKLRLDEISEVNPALTCYHRDEPAPVLPLREEPDLLSWLESTGKLVDENEGDSQEISTIEEEELSALMGEKEDYKTEDDSSDDDWED
tara:strand:+ start:1248 stop:1526 length:279 start_codon:yes stop_codon:yes gene_type:complete